MTAQIFQMPSRQHRASDAQREAAIYLDGRDRVTAGELAAHFVGRGWIIGNRRASHLLAELGWSGQRIRAIDGTPVKVFRRPSPIADGSWRRPWLEPADPDGIASKRRTSRWNLAFVILMAVGAVVFLGQFLRAVL